MSNQKYIRTNLLRISYSETEIKLKYADERNRHLMAQVKVKLFTKPRANPP